MTHIWLYSIKLDKNKTLAITFIPRYSKRYLNHFNYNFLQIRKNYNQKNKIKNDMQSTKLQIQMVELF